MHRSSCLSPSRLPRLAPCLAVCLSAGLASGAAYYAARNGSNTDTAPYDSWGNAASNIQAAVDVAAESDTVWVGPGTYTLPANPTNHYGINVVYIGRPMTLRGATGNPADVLIDGEDSYRPLVVRVTTTTSKPVVLDGLTFCNGRAPTYGGGIMLADHNDWDEYKTIVQNCIVSNNTVAYSSGAYGGGICAAKYMKDLVISNSVLSGNTAEISATTDYGLGGAVYSSTGNPRADLRLIDCLVEDNTAGEGGGIYGDMAALFLDRCTIRNNRATLRYGGGVYLNNPSESCYNRHCLIYNNVAAGYGGAFYWRNKQPLVLDHCTIVSNWSSNAALDLGTSGDPSGLRLNNTILHGNHPAEISSAPVTNLFALNSCVASLTDLIATNCFTDAPGFRDFEGQDFRLAASSPCVNAGAPLAWVTPETLDLAGNPRVDRVFDVVDIGCFERTYAGSILLLR